MGTLKGAWVLIPVLALAAELPAQSRTYRVTALEGASVAYQMAEDGTVALGSKRIGALDLGHVYRDGQYQTLPLPPGCSSAECTAVDSRGNAYGIGYFQGADRKYIKWDASGAHIIDLPLGYQLPSRPVTANSSGSFVASCSDGYHYQHGLLFTASGIRDLTSSLALGNTHASVTDISDAGHVVGTARYVTDDAYVWTVTAGLSLLPVGQRDKSPSSAASVNSDGVIVGRIGSKAHMWAGSTVTELLGVTYPSSINDVKQVVGTTNDQGTLRGVLYTERSGARLLTSMVPGTSDGFVNVRDITSKGWILAHSVSLNKPVLLKPDTIKRTPTAATFTNGSIVSGTLQDLSSADGKPLRVQRTEQSVSEPIRFTLDSPSGSNPGNLWKSLRCRADRPGSFEVKVNFFDWRRGVFDPASLTQVVVNSDWKSFENVARGDLTRYRRSSDGKVRVLVRVTSSNGLGRWAIDFDQGQIEEVPE